MFDSEQIQAMLQKGYSLAEICATLGYSYNKAYRWCKANGMELSRSANGKSRATLAAREKQQAITTADHSALKKMYVDDNLSLAAIAKHYNTTSASVAAALRRCSIPVKLKNGKYNRYTPTQPKKLS